MLQFNNAKNRSFALMAIVLTCLPVIDNATAQGTDPLALVPAPDNSSGSTGAPGIGDTNPQFEEKVTLDFRATPLGDVLRTLADQSSINIVIGRSVNQSELVTLRLSDVTYRTAMQTILQMNSLDAQTKDNILRIDSIERVTNEITQKKNLKIGEWNSQPTRVMIWQLNYASANTVATLLDQMIKSKYAGLTNLSVTTDARTNKLMIESIPEVLERAKTFIQVLDKRKRQVLIEARIVEASRELSKSLGVNWGTRFALDGRNGLSTGLVFPNSIVGSVGGAGNVGNPSPDFSAAGPRASNGTTALSIGSINSLINLDAVITAYETESMANIISSPRIVVEDQDTANINETTRKTSQVISGQIVINNSANYELSLTVTPKITNDGNIQMAISVNRGTPGSDAPVNGVETSTNRSAKTNLSVGDGDTAVIGGLYQSNKTESIGRIPILGDLPLIGWLFRSKSRGSLRTELMVLITPRLVKEKGDGSGGVAESGSSANSILPVSSSSSIPNDSLNNSSLNNASSNNSGSNFVNNGSLNSTNTTSANPVQTDTNNQSESTPNAGNPASDNSFPNNNFSDNEFSNETSNDSLNNNSGNSSNSGNF
jgi:type IV pilus assembly protein PilQ